VEDVARDLGMSQRTLARKLSDEGLNFTDILQQLRHDLAVRYLDDQKLHVMYRRLRGCSASVIRAH
jgi:AraC-like DNA-binding protein